MEDAHSKNKPYTFLVEIMLSVCLQVRFLFDGELAGVPRAHEVRMYVKVRQSSLTH